MKNLLVTIALMGVIGFSAAQETPKSKKSKSKTDTIMNRTTKTEKKSTYKTDSTKSHPVNRTTTTTKKTKTHTHKDSVSRNPSTRKDSVK